MQYKFNFILASFLAALIQISEFLMVAIVLYKFGAIQGWSMHEIGYLFAVMTLSKTLYRTFADEVHHLEHYLVNGELDQLTRPMPVFAGAHAAEIPDYAGRSRKAVFCSGGRAWHDGGRASRMERGAAIALYYRHGSRHPVLDRTCDRHVRFWTTRITELQNITEDAARTAPVSAHAVSQMDVVDPADRGPGRFSQLHPVIIHTAGRARSLGRRIGWSGSGMSLLKSEILAVWFDQISKYRELKEERVND